MKCPIQFFLLAILVCPCKVWSQNTYKLKYHVDVPVVALGLGSFTSSYIIGKDKAAPSPQQITVLNKDDIWRFDRSAADNWSPQCGKVSDALLYSSIAMPGLLFMNKNVRKERRMVGMMWAETMLLSAGVTCLVKEVSNRYRPFVYNESASADIKESKDARMSFFSGHTSLAASSTFFMAKVYSDLNPNSRWKPLVWTSAATLPAIVGTLRYCAGKHYPTDILVGYVTGAAIGYLVPHLHKKMRKTEPEYLPY